MGLAMRLCRKDSHTENLLVIYSFSKELLIATLSIWSSMLGLGFRMS